MAIRNCRACRGRKKYWGAGMMHEYDCESCKGTGKEEYDELVETMAEKPVEAVAEVVVEKPSTKPAPKTIPVQPLMKNAVKKKK